MKFGNFTLLLSIGLLIGLSACSTSSEAEAEEPTEQAEQAQTQQQTDDHAAHHPKGQQAGAQHQGDKQKADKQQMMMAKMCPMKVEGTTRQVVKLDDAVVMDFTTTGDVEELRQRVQKMAQMHEKMHAEGGMMHGGMHGEQGQMQHGKMQNGKMTEKQRQMRQQMMQMMSDVTVTTEEIDAGMRMKFTPKDAAQADKLYQMMQKHTQMMQENGQCPMMQMMGGGPVEDQNE
jgi:hypothetical protein